MRHRVFAMAEGLIVALVICALRISSGQVGFSIAQTTADANFNSNPCAAPNEVVGSPEETAWLLWIAATCPVNNDQYPYVVWENWIDQELMYPADPSKGLKVPNARADSGSLTRLLHPSPLTLLKNGGVVQPISGLGGGADQDCNKATVPPNGQPNLVLCEEVRLNGAAEDYVSGANLWNRTSQTRVAATHGLIQFSPPSIEVKVDWVELSSIGLDCNNLPPSLTAGVHIETIQGNCFALAGIAIISKLKQNWIWATFEPQNSLTNPNRCQVLGCNDFFGSFPPITHGANTSLTPQLASLMAQANLASEWKNYRLDGVQINFLDQYGQPTLLGNSVTEGENAGVPLTESSCITCHALSSIKNDGTDGATLLNSNPVGLPQPLPSFAWIRRDFLWSLSEACPNSPFQTCN
jgi:hypothetical protein